MNFLLWRGSRLRYSGSEEIRDVLEDLIYRYIQKEQGGQDKNGEDYQDKHEYHKLQECVQQAPAHSVLLSHGVEL